MEAVRGQKHPSEAKNGMKELIYWNKCLIKVAQKPHKPPIGSNQIWATTSGYDFWGHRGHSSIAVTATVVVNTYEFREAEDPSLIKIENADANNNINCMSLLSESV